MSTLRLPQRHPAHKLEAQSRERFRSLFREPLFLVRDEPAPDYGVDLSVEALIDKGKSPTNIRCFVQLKATERQPSPDGGYAVNVKASNVVYLTNAHSSFYVLYTASTGKFYYRSALDVLEALHAYGAMPSYKKYLSVGFTEELTKDRVAQIHAQMIAFASDVREAERLFSSDAFGEVIFGRYEDRSNPEAVTGVYGYRVDEYGNQIRMEHEIWVHNHGRVPSGFEVFHKNGHSLDNRDENLGLRPIETRRFRLGIFPAMEENANARKIFEVMVHGEKAVGEKSEPPDAILFWRVVRELQDQGLSMMQEDVEAYKARCAELLNIDLRPCPIGTRSEL